MADGFNLFNQPGQFNAFVPSAQTSQLLAARSGTPFDILSQFGVGLQRQRQESEAAEAAGISEQAILDLAATQREEDVAFRERKQAFSEGAATRKLEGTATRTEEIGAARRATLATDSKLSALTDRQLGLLGAGQFGKKGQTINIGTGESAATKEFGKSIGKGAADRNTQASLAITNNASLDRFSQALDSGALTGIGRETIGDLRNLSQSFGIDIDAGIKALGFDVSSLSEEQVVRAIGNRLALQLRNPKSGGGLPGATSNRDLKFLTGAVPGLSRTVEGNRAMIQMVRKLNGMKIDIAKEQARIIQESKGIPFDLDARILDFANKLVLFTDEEKREIETLSGSGGDRAAKLKRQAELRAKAGR